ncbi:MAG: NADH:flavin oxidoreductase [Candidatus Hodarchaeales archaeon]
MFTPGRIGNLRTENRFIRSATAEFGANEDGTLSKHYSRLYEALVKGKIGIIIQGHMYVMDEGKAHKGMAGISQDFHIPSLQKLLRHIRSFGSSTKLIAQINHGGVFSVSKKAPSERDDKKTVCMTDDDIEAVIQGFKKAASRVKKIGYDGVQIHAAHGYLISQFLSEETNKRTDNWGGNLENRSRLLKHVYLETREEVGSQYPILVKMNGTDIPKPGYPIENGIKVAQMLFEEGLDLLEVSGMKSTRKIDDEDTYFVPYARKIKDENEDLVISIVGGFRSFNTIQKYRNEFADFISLSRPFIREPKLIKKFKSGKETVDCISCNKCFSVEDIVKCRAEEEIIR